MDKEMNCLVDELMKAMPIVKKGITKIIEKGDVTPGELDSLSKAATFLEKMTKVCGGGEESEMMYGMRSYGNMHGGYGMYGDPMMMDGYSERRGRSPVTGRYVSRGMDGGYSGHSIEDRMIASLEQQMDGAKSDYERKVIMDEINRIRTGAMNNR